MKRNPAILFVLLFCGFPLKADIIVTHYIDNTHGYITRYNNELSIVWRSGNEGGVSKAIISPINGNLYAAYNINDRLVKQFGVAAGDYIGLTVPAGDYVNDLKFGYDYSDDDVRDLWTVSRDAMYVYDGATTTGTGAATLLNSWIIADSDGENGTGGSAILFGPDITGDGIGELYVGKGINASGGRVNIWNPVTMAKLTSINADSTRDIGDIELGPDVNGDGRQDLIVVSPRNYQLRVYDCLTGANLGVIEENLTSKYFPLDIEFLDDDSVLMGTRMKSELDPGCISGVETAGGNLIQLNRITGSVSYSPTLLAIAPGTERFLGVIRIAPPGPWDGCAEAKKLPDYAALLGDLTDDCYVDLHDLSFLASYWAGSMGDLAQLQSAAADWLESTALGEPGGGEPATAGFVHPGIFHTQADFDRMKAKIAANEEPWLSGYNKMASDSHSSYSYSMQGPYSYISRNPHVSLSQWENDCGAVYQNAVMWTLTGNQAHANKAIQILNGWSSTCTSIIGADARLTAGLQGHKFIAAAEIIRHTAAGWPAANITTCENFIRNVLLPVNRMYGGGNWGNINAVCVMAAGIFLEDEALFNEGVNVLRYGAPTECDAGIEYYIDPEGWTTEADRDVGHWALGLMNLASGAHIAWCQGADLWTYLNARLLTGHEYLAEYNLGNSVSYTATMQCDGMVNGNLTIDGRGRWDLFFWEQVYHPYQNMLGYNAPFTEAAVDETRAATAGGAEGYDRDHVAFGTLLFALPPRTAGLARVPRNLEAVCGNERVALTWSSADGANSYNVKRATSRSGPYETMALGLTTTGYSDTTVINKTLYCYRVSAVNASGETVDSGVAIAYPSKTPPPVPTGLTAVATSHARIDLSWNASAGATGYTIKRATTSGGPYTTIATDAGTRFPRYGDAGLAPSTTYYYVVSAVNSIGEGATSGEASASTLSALPAPWTYEDAGYLTTPGKATYAAGAFTVKGAGLDYGGYRADAFGMAYRTLTGDGEIVARYASRQNYSQICKTGITMRESVSGGSRHVFAFISGGNDASFIYRSSTNGAGTSSGTTSVPNSTLPQWLKLTRSGGTFTGYVSPDGSTWTQLNSVNISMNDTILVGLAVCSRNNGMLDTAVFDNVTVTNW